MRNRIVWLAVAVVLAIALGAGGTYAVMAGQRSTLTTRLTVLEKETADIVSRYDALSAEASRATAAAAAATAVTATIPATTTPLPKPPAKPKTTMEWAFLTGGSASGGKLYIKADYIYFYSGAAATAAHAKYGGSLRPDGTYVRNTSSAIKTLTLLPTAKIQLVEWLETGTPGSSWKYGVADPNAFVAVLAGTATSPSGVWSPAGKAILLTVTGSSVSEVKQYTAGP
jgi:hypothetical protein